ncbi:MAG: hypothetical protein A3C71_01035 [Candidatus Yanofskybacteria bacterium RIFCSPHIGHO2_02_FULL_43_15c]|uniref:Transposase IS200-like domain-containing protein n=1 Tax=Candidatus Yanofskybacteria bacterium RIFCSPHIGHO2_02_FULL_43_15c TaxID=1802679 RepID=A0A1F8FKB5_9BACT|nr:MAG: hypothetical protein A3C71_01035 [Candidatus Yanofskybacteria bacterium RIFCSPHIGHO2_02_FULL_43_15c]
MRKIIFSPGEFYHIYNRGTEKRNIFLRKGDYRRFLLLLYHCNNTSNVVLRLEEQHFNTESHKEPLVDIYSYCLMPNHFHLLIGEKIEGGISRFMQKLSIGYTMYFNKLRERSGALFQGKFKATHADNDRYLKYLISYIHLNPVKLIDPEWKENGISDKEKAEEYLTRFGESSYLDYLGVRRPESAILSKDNFPKYFNSGNDFKNMVIDWLDYQGLQII